MKMIQFHTILSKYKVLYKTKNKSYNSSCINATSEIRPHNMDIGFQISIYVHI